MKLPSLIFLLTFGLSLFGLFMVYNTSSVEALKVFGDKFYYFKNQLVWFVIGLGSLILLSRFPYRYLRKLSLPLIIFSFLSLILVLIPGLGQKVLGARRWLNLGFFSFQPSEFLKLSLSIYLAAWLEQKRSVFLFLVIIFLILFLMMLQPDLGTTLILCGSAFLLYFIAGGSLRSLFLFFSFALILGLILIFSSEYRKNRILTFINPSDDPLGKSYHLRQILISLGSGGLTGLGLSESRQKYSYLPEATTDSIFAVIGEELGFLGATVLIGLYLVLIYCGFLVAQKTKDIFGQLLAASLIIWLALQIFLNLGAMVYLLPLTGVPLPFISYGGSSLIVALSSMGILINIAKSRS